MLVIGTYCMYCIGSVQCVVYCIECTSAHFVNIQLTFLTSVAITVNFQPDAYSVIEGDTIEIVLVANRQSSVPFAVTITPDTQGEVKREN